MISMTKKRHRIFLGLTEIAGYYRGLKEGFRQLGADVVFVNLSPHPFGYGDDDENALVKFARFCSRRRTSLIGRVFWSMARTIARCLLLAWASRRCDVFIFACGSSFLRYRDLPILKLLGKTIIYQFHGSDSRPPYLDGSIFPPDEPVDVEAMIKAARLRKRRIRTIEKYADVLVNIPPQGHFHERSFANWMRVGLPNRPPVVPPPEDALSPDGETVRILHCPSHPLAKGTGLIRQAVATLKDEGLDVELVELSGEPNEKILRELARCDVVLDQAYADYPLPGLAVEAAWFSRPVVIAGYAVELWRESLAEEFLPPTCYCTPDQLTAEVRRLVTDAELRRDVGRRLRQFVETRWSPAAVAGRYLSLASCGVPEEWACDPNEITYLHGCGLPEEAARRRVLSVIESGGVTALQLSDKPNLEKLFARFAGGGQS